MTDHGRDTLPAELLIDMRERMVRIETKLDTQQQKQSETDETLNDHEGRLTALETKYTVLASVGAILLFLLTFFQTSIQEAIGLS